MGNCFGKHQRLEGEEENTTTDLVPDTRHRADVCERCERENQNITQLYILNEELKEKINFLLSEGDKTNSKIRDIHENVTQPQEIAVSCDGEALVQEEAVSSQEHKLIRNNLMQLTCSICNHIDELAQSLYAKEVFSFQLKCDIQQVSSQMFKRTTFFLDIILSKGQETYNAFYDSCMECQLWDAADILFPDKAPHSGLVRAGNNSDGATREVDEPDPHADGTRLQEIAGINQQMNTMSCDIEVLKQNMNQLAQQVESYRTSLDSIIQVIALLHKQNFTEEPKMQTEGEQDQEQDQGQAEAAAPDPVDPDIAGQLAVAFGGENNDDAVTNVAELGRMLRVVGDRHEKDTIASRLVELSKLSEDEDMTEELLYLSKRLNHLPINN